MNFSDCADRYEQQAWMFLNDYGIPENVVPDEWIKKLAKMLRAQTANGLEEAMDILQGHDSEEEPPTLWTRLWNRAQETR